MLGKVGRRKLCDVCVRLGKSMAIALKIAMLDIGNLWRLGSQVCGLGESGGKGSLLPWAILPLRPSRC